jgi:hypothetical protein
MNVKAYIGTQIAHASQVFTGLALLEVTGKIKVSYERDFNVGINDPIQRIEVGSMKVVFDLSDGFHFDKKFYDWSDKYFKRMLSPELVVQFPKMQPYGLNYPVYTIGDQSILRSLISRDYRLLLNNLIRRSPVLSNLFNPNLSYRSCLVNHFEGEPGLNKDLRIIYFTRLWNPDNVKSDVKREQRELMNELRRNLVRELRKEFGRHFLGGIIHSDFAVKYAPTEVVTDNSNVHKTNYLENLRRSDIGVADFGLELSVGFKMAEYVAMSKAIVTTPLNTLLPGSFEVGRNYLEYKGTEDCIQQCYDLIQNPELIINMQYQNFNYYKQSLRPDKLIWNCIS